MSNLMIVSGGSAGFVVILRALCAISLTAARFALGTWSARIWSRSIYRICSAVWCVRFDWARIPNVLSRLSAEIPAVDGNGGDNLIY